MSWLKAAAPPLRQSQSVAEESLLLTGQPRGVARARAALLELAQSDGVCSVCLLPDYRWSTLGYTFSIVKNN